MSCSVICIGCRYEALHAHSSDLTAVVAGDACADDFVPLCWRPAGTAASPLVCSSASNPDSQVSYAEDFACNSPESSFSRSYSGRRALEDRALPPSVEGNGMTMINSPMAAMMMLGCGVLALLILAILVLGIAALLKYLRGPA